MKSGDWNIDLLNLLVNNDVDFKLKYAENMPFMSQNEGIFQIL